jgi:hypothetical protein
MRQASGPGAVIRGALALALALVAFAGIGASVASAAQVHVFSESFGKPCPSAPCGDEELTLAEHSGLAVNEESGDVYVADTGNGRVQQFEADGTFVRTFGSLTSPTFIAIDNSAGASKGDVYVADEASATVSKYEADGTPITGWGSSGSIDGSTAPGGPFGGIAGIAVDSAGVLYVYRNAPEPPIFKFDPDGAFIEEFNTEGGTAPAGIAVDPTGSVYKVRGNGNLLKFSPSGATELDQIPCGCGGIAVDSSNGDLYAAFGEEVHRFDSTANPLEAFGSGHLSNASGVTLDASTGTAFVADSSASKIAVFGPAVVPDSTTDAASAVTDTAATLHGTVSADGGPDATCAFQYLTQAEYEANPSSERFAGAEEAACVPAGPFSGSGTEAVSADITGLTPGTTYHVRLNATNSNGTANGADTPFTTADAPIVDVTTFTSEVTETSATLHGTVNPNRAETTYAFQYGTSTAYGSEAPLGGAQIPAGPGPVAIEAALSGLAPDTTYHYRIVATNLAGGDEGIDHAFTTRAPFEPLEAGPFPGRGFLPDQRGWELVSPPDKNGADVMGDSARTRAATDGNAASFSSLGAFADVIGTGVAAEYIAERSTDPTPGNNGWATHAITPQQDPLTYRGVSAALEPLWEGELSGDLTSGVFRAWSPLTHAPMVANVQNLYVRDDLRTPGAGNYALASPCLACTTPLPPIQLARTRPYLAGASADFSHVVFESTFRLTPDSTAISPDVNDEGPIAYNVFEWDNGTLRLVSVVPPVGETSCGSGGPSCTPAASAIAGVGASHNVYTPHVVSNDGSRVFFTDTSASPGARSGVLYERIDGTRTLQINASERTDCADHDPCSGTLEPDPNGPQPATYETASNDGKRVFFLTTEQLIDSDTNPQVDLYMYDEEAPAGERLTRLSADPGTGESLNAQGVIGTSDDGHWVYFLGDGRSMYVWHDGTMSFIGRLDDGRDADINHPTDWNLLTLQARVTPNGHQLLVASHSGTGLTGRDHRATCGTLLDVVGNNPCQALYLYNADDGSTACVSCNPNGGPVTGNATTNVRELYGGALTTWHLSHPLSNDGTKAFFSTPAALVPGDTNGYVDAYEWRAQGTGGCAHLEGCLHLLSSGTDPADSYFMDASANGSDVFVLTRQQLVGWDTDHAYDLYDARVGGGFPEPPAVTAPCNGDSCHPASAPAPAAPGAGSAAFSGPDNPHPRRCPRGRHAVRRHGKTRCLKPHRHKSHKRHARNNRRVTR